MAKWTIPDTPDDLTVAYQMGYHEDMHTAEIARLTARVAELESTLDDACSAMSDLCNAPIGIIPKSSDRFYDYRSGLFRAPLTSKDTQNND